MKSTLKEDEVMLTLRVEKKFAKALTALAKRFQMNRSQLIRGAMTSIVEQLKNQK